MFHNLLFILNINDFLPYGVLRPCLLSFCSETVIVFFPYYDVYLRETASQKIKKIYE